VTVDSAEIEQLPGTRTSPAIKILIARKLHIATIVSTPIILSLNRAESAPSHRQRSIQQVPPAEFGNIYLAVAINQRLLLAFFAMKIYQQFITSTEDKQYKPHFLTNSYIS